MYRHHFFPPGDFCEIIIFEHSETGLCVWSTTNRMISQKHRKMQTRIEFAALDLH